MSASEETLLRRYVDSFNRHDIDAVMGCFHENPVIVDMDGTRHEGGTAVRRFYEKQFAAFPDARCDITRVIGGDGTGMAETHFTETHARTGTVIEAIGPEVVQVIEDKIAELRDYHRLTNH
jgi:hypothetical protein